MNYGMLILSYALCFVPITVMFAIMPYIGRKTVCFGISIPSGQHDKEELAVLRRGYARNVSIIGAVMTAVYVALVFILEAYVVMILMGVFMLVYLTAVYSLYLRRWRQVKVLKARYGWETESRGAAVADTRFSAVRRAVSPAWFVLHVIIILATVLIGVLMYDQIPDKVVQQTDLAGNVTRLAEKSFGLILFAPVTQVFMLLVFAFIYWSMLKAPPVLDPDNPEISSRQNAASRYRWSAWLVAFGALLLLTLFAVQLALLQLVDPMMISWASMIATGLGVVSALIIAMVTGQSGSRVRLGKRADGEVIRRDDDKYWKWGVYYVNRDDPALFVEKRFGVGFTINFGRPAAIFMMIGLLVLIAVFSYVLPALLK